MSRHVMSLIFFITATSATNTFGYADRTHTAINKTVIHQRLSTFPLNDYFEKHLNLSTENDSINDKKIIDWFKEAGAQEDRPPWRTPNHFLDPLANKGFSGFLFSLIFSGSPTAVWAQMPVGKQSVWGSYSWRDAREYFYTALTSNSGTVREEHLAKSFRALGQVMHLAADMSVPEHTRDTGHVGAKTIEPWLERVLDPEPEPEKRCRESKFKPAFDYAVTHPFIPDPLLLQKSVKFPGVSIPIANLYDSEQYVEGSSPSVTVSDPVGLAEYTNANFFSFNTIFDDFEHPSWSSIELREDSDDESGKLMTFIRRKQDAVGEHVEHLAQANVFCKYLDDARTNGFTLENDKVFKDYMEKLIPRAAGYAGALVDYFYRGDIEVKLNEGGVTFRSIRIQARNITLNGEEMGPGEAALVIRYKGLRETPLGGNRYLLHYPSEEYSYKVVKISNITIPRDAPAELTFDFSADPLPFNFDDLSLQLVFKGRLGNEDCTVAVGRILPQKGIYSDFNLHLPSSGVYAKTADHSLNAAFNELRVTAETDMPGGLAGGVFQLALEYRQATTDPFQSEPVETAPEDAAAYLIRLPEANGVTTLPQGTPVELVFDLSSAPLPTSATHVELNVIYSGTGNDGRPTISAVGYRDISEPTPVDLFNNTDKVCIKGHWYNAGSPEALAAVADNGIILDDENDIFAHEISDIYYKASPSQGTAVTATPTSYDLSEVSAFPPGSYRKIGYIITDYSFNYNISEIWKALSTEGEILWSYPRDNETYSGAAVRCDEITYPSMYVMRGIKMWGGAGVIYDNDYYPQGSDCPWDAIE